MNSLHHNSRLTKNSISLMLAFSYTRPLKTKVIIDLFICKTESGIGGLKDNIIDSTCFYSFIKLIKVVKFVSEGPNIHINEVESSKSLL